MLKTLLLTGFFALNAHASELTCEVKGMHCQGCTEMVEGKICDAAKYQTCEIKITDEKKEQGRVHLVTKDAAATIDEKAIIAQIEDAGYKPSCKAVKAKAKAPSKTSKAG